MHKHFEFLMLYLKNFALLGFNCWIIILFGLTPCFLFKEYDNITLCKSFDIKSYSFLSKIKKQLHFHTLDFIINPEI